ncbi:hypothetical protein BH10BAC6_BH10BAC6_13090 [soil metagenome]
MTELQPLIGRADACDRILQACERTMKGSGEVLIVRAEPGMGKSELLTWIQDACKATLPDLTVLRVDCRPPIGSFHAGGIQPLQPFGHAIEQMYIHSGAAAKKRLALNIGMSVLASIPIAGDLFYAVKAISQDVSEYKRETSALQQKKRAAIEECIGTLTAIAERQPYVLLVDDGHWADSQSVEVLRALVDLSHRLPLLLVWTVTSTVSQRINPTLTSLMHTPSIADHTIGLQALSLAESSAIVHALAPSHDVTEPVLARLHDRTAGIPGILVEYVKYLERNGDFSDDLAVTIGEHPNTDVVLQEIPEADAVILSLCAAEGQEFTAFMISALMNTDVLTTVRELRRIQQTTGLIKSLGMRTRYGVKTTTYEFVQSFAYTYFLHRPEYEERKAVHQRISDVLQREFSQTPHDEMRPQLAVFIAAHSAEAGDTATTERMLSMSADHARAIGADDIRGFIIRDLLPLYGGGVDDEVVALSDASSAIDRANVDGGGSLTSAMTFAERIRALSNMLIEGRAFDVAEHCSAVLVDVSVSFTTSERVTLLCLGARAFAERDALLDAESNLQRAEQLAAGSPRELCMILNVRATIQQRQGNLESARELLFVAARHAESLPMPSRLLTLSNIVLLLRAMNDPGAERYERTVRKLTTELSWNALRTDLRL